MSIENIITARRITTVPVASARTSSSVELNNSPVPAQPAIIPSSTVSISGEALLKQRIFGYDDPSHKFPPVLKSTMETRASPSAKFLTDSDRQLLIKVYEFAQEQGVHLRYVDSLAFTLDGYRFHEDGRILMRHSQGKFFDLEGHTVTYGFTDKNTITVKRILNSEALKTTELDHGFIRFSLDEDRGALAHLDFEFLEQVINKFSAKGGDVAPLDAKFAHHEYKDFFIKHRSKEVSKDWGGRLEEATGASPSKEKMAKKAKAVRLETLQDTLRRIMSKVLRANSKTGIPSLADFLMKFRR